MNLKFPKPINLMRIIILNFFILSIQCSWAQDLSGAQCGTQNSSGSFQLGARSTVSLFNDGNTDNFGKGIGGQFRIQFADRINTDWFFDYLTSDIGNVANRTDYHIGWSVLFYPYLKERQLIKPYILPYILAGHCFDYSLMVENNNSSNKANRFSSAVQAGIGTHINLSPRLDLSLTSQYMIHLGSHIDPIISNGNVFFQKEKGASLEGHLLTTISINYKIGNLW